MRDVTPQDPQELLKLIRERAKEGGSTEGLFRAWLGLVVPEAPDELLDRTAASVATRGETWAWNRRKRRQLLLARNGVLLNLFAGSTRQCFQAFADRNHMALLDIDLQEDLALEQTFSSLLSLALCGRIKILLAGPPCRTYSVLRSRPGGPPVVREGPERWGLEGIPWIEAQKVEGDNVLWVRTAALLYAAKDSNEVLGLGPLYGLIPSGFSANNDISKDNERFPSDSKSRQSGKMLTNKTGLREEVRFLQIKNCTKQKIKNIRKWKIHQHSVLFFSHGRTKCRTSWRGPPP